MHRSLVARVALALGLLAGGLAAASPVSGSPAATTMAIIGDTPYGGTQFKGFPALVDAINAAPHVSRVVHLGDTKDAQTFCTDEYNRAVGVQFSRFEDPLIYTPGDNEWTDCHRPQCGGFDPLERLDALRREYFPVAGETLGRNKMRVEHQPSLIENVRWVDSSAVFATFHVVGSNNGMDVWTAVADGGPGDDPARRIGDVRHRTAAVLEWIDSTFDVAEARGLRGVALLMQANTWNPAHEQTQRDAFFPIVDRIEARSRAFEGEVLVLQGDSHSYLEDRPLATTAPNLTRVVVEGVTVHEWLRLVVDPGSDRLFSWQRVRLPE